MLHIAEAKYRALVEHFPGFVYVAALGDYGDMNYVSPGIERLLGVSPKDWVTNPSLWIEHVHPADRRRVLTQMVDRHNGGEPHALEYRMVSRDGTVRWFRDVATVIDDLAGNPCLLHGLMLEIASTPEDVEDLRQMVEKQGAMLAHAMSSAAILAPDGTIVFEGQADTPPLGFGAGVLLGSNIFDLLHPDDLGPALDIFDRLVVTPDDKGEGFFRARHADGSWVKLYCVAKSMVHRPEIGGIVLSCIPVPDGFDYGTFSGPDESIGVPGQEALEDAPPGQRSGVLDPA